MQSMPCISTHFAYTNATDHSAVLFRFSVQLQWALSRRWIVRPIFAQSVSTADFIITKIQKYYRKYIIHVLVRHVGINEESMGFIEKVLMQWMIYKRSSFHTKYIRNCLQQMQSQSNWKRGQEREWEREKKERKERERGWGLRREWHEECSGSTELCWFTVNHLRCVHIILCKFHVHKIKTMRELYFFPFLYYIRIECDGKIKYDYFYYYFFIVD